MKNKEKTIYDLELHETIRVSVEHIEWHITRVANGWIYSHVRLDMGQMNAVFVPFNNEFQFEIPKFE